jgi:thymidylate synthase
MNSIDLQYQNLLNDIIKNGVNKKDRTGTGTISVFGRQIRHKMSEGFPLITTKKMAWKSLVTELVWFLRGETSIEYLLENECNIWNGDAYKNYITRYNKGEYVGKTKFLENSKKGRILTEPFTQEEFINKIKTDNEFAKTWASLGKIYGFQWRNWNGEIDQISELIKQIKENPDSRRLIVSAWNSSDLPYQVLPPCHYGFQVYTRELSYKERYDHWFNNNYETGMEYNPEIIPNFDDVYFTKTPTRSISLMYNARSQDVPLGTPFNIASYALLLEIIAKMVNMVPDELIANMGDCHIYLNQIDGIKEQLKREPYPLPDLVISNQINFNEGINEFLSSCLISDFKIENYQSHPPIKMPLSN